MALNNVSFRVNPQDQKEMERTMKRLQGFPRNWLEFQDTMVERTVKQMKIDADLLGVRDTGRLIRNIGATYHDHTEHQFQVEFHSVAIDPDTGEDYAPLQVYGTRGRKGRNYFHPNVRRYFKAIGRVAPKWLRDLSAKGNKQINWKRYVKYFR